MEHHNWVESVEHWLLEMASDDDSPLAKLFSKHTPVSVSAGIIPPEIDSTELGGDYFTVCIRKRGKEVPVFGLSKYKYGPETILFFYDACEPKESVEKLVSFFCNSLRSSLSVQHESVLERGNV